MLRPINLAGIDLNLLVAFEALLEERSVSRAADKIGLSQPSMSHALKRLRDLLGDELFRRTAAGMVPTPRALALSGPIIAGLAKLRGALDARTRFDPLTSRRHFMLGMPDVGTFALMPRLMPTLRAQAPGADVTILDLDPKQAVRSLQLGAIDIAVNSFPELPSDLNAAQISTVRMVCVLDRGNPALVNGTLDLDAFLGLPHVVVGRVDEPRHPVDFEMGALGLSRRTALRLPHFLAIPGAVVGTDLVGIFDSYTARAFAGWPDLIVVPAPLPATTIAITAIWHPRSNEDAAHVWFRSLLLDLHRIPAVDPTGASERSDNRSAPVDWPLTLVR